jgi:hypothetical protein
MHAYSLLTSLLETTAPLSFALTFSTPMGAYTPVVHTMPIGNPSSHSAHDRFAISALRDRFEHPDLLAWFARCTYLYTPCATDPTPPALLENTQPPYPACFRLQVDKGKATHVSLSTLLYKPSSALSIGTRTPWRLWIRSSALLKSTKDLRTLMQLLPLLEGPYTLVESFNHSNQASLYKAGPKDSDILMADSLSRRFQQTIRALPNPTQFSLAKVAKLHHFEPNPVLDLAFSTAYS